MSEALDKVRGVRELPVFPLPLVLFPGVPLPLHIFEERYRRMLADVRASNNLFGLSYFVPDAVAEERPPAGHVGCATEVVEVQSLPDGRSNILTVGVARYIKSAKFANVARVRWTSPFTGNTAELSFTGVGTTLRGARMQRKPGGGWAYWDNGTAAARNEANLDSP